MIRRFGIRIACLTAASVMAGTDAVAQQVTALTLDAAVHFALAHHPTVAAALAGVEQAEADVQLASASRLPALDVQSQVNRATGNVVAGTLFPMAGLPAISGPPGSGSPDGGSWTTSGALVLGIPLTGTLRNTRIVTARLASTRSATAQLDEARLHVAAAAAAAFLDLRAAQEQLRAALASRRRSLALDTVTRALAREGLRPGADSARSDADLAAADIDVERGRRNVAIAALRLRDAIGANTPVTADTSTIAGAGALPGGQPAVPIESHPALRRAAATRDAAVAERAAASTAWWPRVDIVSAAWTRGSGQPVPATVTASRAAGLVPTVGNWAIGLVASWPLLGGPTALAQRHRADADIAAADARAQRVAQVVTEEQAEAAVTLAGAVEIGRRTVIGVTAARRALEQTTARYGAGLTSLADVADAERLLTRAEVADATAQLDIVAARLGVARASGSLSVFLAAFPTDTHP